MKVYVLDVKLYPNNVQQGKGAISSSFGFEIHPTDISLRIPTYLSLNSRNGKPIKRLPVGQFESDQQ